MIKESNDTSHNNVPTADLREFWRRRKLEIKAELNCITIGTIEAFNGTDQTATISINYKAILKGGVPLTNGAAKDKVIDYPILLKCPIMILTGGSFHLTFPIAKGDTCLVLFCDRDIDNWFQTGDVNGPPATERMHDMSDAVALVGIRSLSNPIPNYNTDIASMFDLHGERFAQTGDIKDSIRTTDHDGWIMMRGDTVGKATGTYQGEQYRELFGLLKLVSPNSGTEDFDAGGTVVIPDMRGRGRVCADNMGGSQKGVLTTTYTPNRDVLGGTIGEEAHQLTIPEMPSHTHNVQADAGGGVGHSGASGTVGAGYYTEATGGDVPHNTVQPGMIFNTFIKI